MPQPIEDHQKLFAERIASNPDIVAAELRLPGFRLHYRSVGAPKDAVMVWIHGTPGGWGDIAQLMLDDAFLSRARLVSLDRPGWGASRFEPEARMAGTFDEHGALIEPLLQQLRATFPGVPLIVAGHSWGAPMAVWLGASYPELVDGVLALAGPYDPTIRILRWYNYAARIPGIPTLIGRALRNSNEEMFLLRDQITAAERLWHRLRVPLIVVHGADDSLVPSGHVDYARRVFPEATTRVLVLPDQGHLLQFQRTELIGRCALALATGRLDDCRESPLNVHQAFHREASD
ncbi:MAG: alpha/beta hydrolase [Pseudomonadota bacterium]